jgi:hypothetical protein
MVGKTLVVTRRGDFTRQGFLGATSEEMLALTRVAIVGVSGGGSHIAQQLAHIGIGDFRLIDPQRIDRSNLNRLVTASDNDVRVRRAKARILKRYILGVRPWATVEAHIGEWGRAEHLLRDAHVVFGCVDSYRGRRNLEAFCRRYLLPYIDIGMNVERLPSGNYAVSGQMILTIPGGPCLMCLGFLTEDRINREEEDYGDAGPAPQVVWTNGTLASMAVGAFIESRTPWFEMSDQPYIWLELEGNEQFVRSSRMPRLYPPGPCPHYSNPRNIGDPRFTLPRP